MCHGSVSFEVDVNKSGTCASAVKMADIEYYSFKF